MGCLAPPPPHLEPCLGECPGLGILAQQVGALQVKGRSVDSWFVTGWRQRVWQYRRLETGGSAAL